MDKEVVKKVHLLICICSLVLSINYMMYVKQNINEIKLINLNTNIIIKPDNYYAINNKIEEKKPSLAKQTVKLKSNKTLSRGGELEYDMTFELTFYSGLACENSKYGAVNCKGVKLFDGIVANNVLPYGTKIKLEGWGNVEVLDVGGSNFDTPHRLDVYVPRIEGESDNEYYNRVQRMGRVKVQGKIIK